MITKAIVAIIVLFIIPELLGLLILRFWKEQKNNIIFAFVLGYIVEFAITQLISVPLIFKDATFTELMNLYIAIIGGLSIFSFIINIFRIVELFKSIFKDIRKTPILQSIFIIFLIGLQLFSFIKYGHIDDDDAYYVATATVSVQTDTLYKYSALTGTSKPNEQSILRYRLGPFPIFLAIISKLVDIHPAIMAHTIIPVIFLPISYMIYWLFAKYLYKDNKKSAILFMFIIYTLHLFSLYNGKNNFIFALFRIWQGKSVLANIILPFTIVLFLYGEEKNINLSCFISLLLTGIGGNLTTTMSIAMFPITIMLISLSFEIGKLITKQTKLYKSFAVITKCLITCIPSILYGLIYIKDYFIGE